MKAKTMAVSLMVLHALAAAPLQAAGEPAKNSAEIAEVEHILSQGDDAAKQAAQEEAAQAAETTPREEAAQATDATPKKEAAPPAPPSLVAPPQAAPAASTASAQTEGSWWGNLKYRLGIGNDPNPGVTVEHATKGAALPADYIIGPGDQIGISVWRDENLTRTVVVLPDGKIDFPLVGEMIAGGKTVAQLKTELESGLSRYISDTGVTVEVKQSNSMIIYVIGKVNVPGRQLLLAKTNVLQALAMVGGLNPFADEEKIKVFREEGGKTIMLSFNYKDVSEGRHLETNVELKRGDVIIVP